MSTPNPLDPSLEEQAAELDDTAAEPDDTSPDDDDGDDLDHADDDADDEPVRYTGTCVGGLYHGTLVTSRYPSGFLLVDRPSGTAWVYDWSAPPNTFTCRDPAGAPLDEEGRWKAAEGDTYDVIAYDREPPQ